jgi:hypothetical protein
LFNFGKTLGKWYDERKARTEKLLEERRMIQEGLGK